MALSESERIRIRLDALAWRLREAADDLEKVRLEAVSTEQNLRNARLAYLLEEEGPADLSTFAAHSEAIHSRVENEESLVQNLIRKHASTQKDYNRALHREWVHRLLERWKQSLEVESEG